jgi:pyridoxamine 5'-phosphate oxidase
MNPHSVIARWLDAASSLGVKKASAFCLTTLEEDGAPTSRMMLASEVTASGVIFCTDSRSPKVAGMSKDSRAAAVFYWHPLRRQIRIRGRVEAAEVRHAEMDFNCKSPSQQLEIISLVQSASNSRYRDIPARLVRDRRLGDERSYERPDHWCAYLLRTSSVEFFVGEENRLNRRLSFTYHSSERWRCQGLLP